MRKTGNVNWLNVPLYWLKCRHGRHQVEHHSADFLKKYVATTTTLFEGSPGCARVTREQCGASVAYPPLSLVTVSTLMHALCIMSFSALVDLSASNIYTKIVSNYQEYVPFSLTTSRCAGSSLARLHPLDLSAAPYFEVVPPIPPMIPRLEARHHLDGDI